MYIYRNEFLLYFSISIILEYYQCKNAQPSIKFFKDTYDYFLFYLAGFSIENRMMHFITKFIFLCYVVFETICWITTHNGICPQVTLSILDWRYTVIMRPYFLLYAFIAFILAAFFCAIPSRKFGIKSILISSSIVFLIRFFFVIAVFDFVHELKYRIDPYDLSSFTSPDNPLIDPYFNSRNVEIKKPHKMKNLIIFHIECLEQRSLGIFNSLHPNLMPFLSSLALQGTLFNNVTMHIDQSFTLSSVFVQHSGLPMLGFSYQERGSLLLSKRVHTIPDILHQLGYNQMASCTGFCSAYQFYGVHHIRTIDAVTHGKKHDSGHANWMINKLLPELAEDQKKQPFTLIVHNEDTHPEYHVDNECFRELSDEMKKWPISLQAIQCYDKYLKRIFDKIIELDLHKTSEIYIYGDHLLWGNHDYYPEPRKLVLMFPFREKRMINKSITLYDIAPTLIHLMGIEEYWPKFPFGIDALEINNKMTTLPTINDRTYINNLAHFF